MKKALVLLVLWLLAGCASAAATSAVTKSSPQATLQAQSSPAAPTQGTGGGQGQPTATASGDQSLPMTWGGHGLSGHLLLILYKDYGDQLVTLDLQSGSYQILFQAPDKSKLTGASLSPDGKQFLLSYSAPTGDIQLGNTDLYLLAATPNSQPQPLQMRKAKEESYFDAAWNQDGTQILYSHFYQTYINNNPVYNYEIESSDLAGHSQKLIANAYWPVLSPDNSKIAYVFSDPKLFGNDLYVSDASGKNAKAISTPGQTPPVDAHFFSKDGKTIYFSMVNAQTQPVRYWWENLFGIETVSAHNVPSDWYKVPAAGGKIERVTNVADTAMFGALSPDGSRMVFISANGLFSVKTDGSDLVKLSDGTFDGTVQWLP